MSEEAFARRVHLVGALADPVRRALYRFVADQPGAVSRDQAADGIDVPRHTAKHHLDKLVDAGLLVPEFRRLTGRTGPGAGRPAKLYRTTRREIGVSIPARRYDLAGEVLADAVEQALAGVPMADALDAAARRAAEAAVEGTDTLGDAVARTTAVLAAYGYEPRPDDGDVELTNCPYARLSRGHDVVCGLNRQFLSYAVGAVAEGALRVVPRDPEGGACCARIRPA